jgi:hypothetical protein
MNPFEHVPEPKAIRIEKIEYIGDSFRHGSKRLYVNVPIRENDMGMISMRRTKSLKLIEKATQKATDSEFKWDKESSYLTIDDLVLTMIHDRLTHVPSELISFYLEHHDVDGILTPVIDEENNEIMWKLLAIKIKNKADEKSGGSSDDD